MNTAKYVDNLVANLKAEGKSVQEIAWQAALACVDWSYVYSAWGAECTPSERRKRYKMCPSHETIKTKCKAFDSGDCSGCKWFPGGERTRCFDCRGFTDWCLKQVGFDLYGDTCSTQWNHSANWKAKGEIATMPADTLCCLFVYKGGKWTHTGFGLNNETVECSSGVQHFTTRNKKWTHWAVPACIGGDIPTPTPTPTPTPSKHSTLRRGDKGPEVVELQTDLVQLGYGIGPLGIDGDYGRATKAAVEQFQLDHPPLVVDGICGPATWAAIEKALADQDDQPVPVITYSVLIKGLSLDEAKRICEQYQTAEIIEGSAAK